MDFRARGRDLPALVEISPGNRIVPGTDVPPGECVRQARSDRFGVLDLAPFLWRGALPGSDDPRPLFVRDLGPARNAALLQRYRARTPWVYMMTDPASAPVLVAYDEAMSLLWDEAAAP
jgi:hypothetical protein